MTDRTARTGIDGNIPSHPSKIPRDDRTKQEGIRAQVRSFPDEPGVYLFKNDAGTVLYVGKAVSLRKRTASYFGPRADRDPKTRSLMERVSHAEYILTEDENQAFLLENNLIKNHQPRYNILLRDDKTYPYLRLTLSERYPRVLVSRRPKPDGSLYYGPYPNLRVRETLSLLRRSFGLCDCKKPSGGPTQRACLRYQMKQCPGPCIGAVTTADYAKNVVRVRMFLEGRHDLLTGSVRKEMERASEAKEYEEAARLRDLLASIVQMRSDTTVVTTESADCDAVALVEGMSHVLAVVLQMRQGRVLGNVKMRIQNEMGEGLRDVLMRFLAQYYSPGVFLPPEVLVPRGLVPSKFWCRWWERTSGGSITLKTPARGWRLRLMKLAAKNALDAMKEEAARTALLGQLQKALGHKRPLRTIVGLDISTLQGRQTVGSAVFFRDGLPETDAYRKFRIKTVNGTDDYAALREMVRRYCGLLGREDNPLPDLFLIDGGRGQLTAVLQVLGVAWNQGHCVAALAKREEQVWLPGRGKPVDFKGREKALQLLMRVRDEAHRFAVGYHRVLRDRQALQSVLEEVKGLGKGKIETLIRRFGSVDAIRKADREQIGSTPGISGNLADRIIDFLERRIR